MMKRVNLLFFGYAARA